MTAPFTLGSTFRPSSSRVGGQHRRISRGCLTNHWGSPLAAIVVQPDLTVVSDARVDFDGDFGAKYGIKKGVQVNEAEGEVFAPVAMWLEALDLVLQRLQAKKTPLNRIRGISGSCQQHGSVYWSREAETLLGGLKPDKSLVDQLTGAFSHPYAPNWQDHSTQAECDQYDAKMGTPERLAEVTGSAAHHVGAPGRHVAREGSS
jgi:xylulokinase